MLEQRAEYDQAPGAFPEATLKEAGIAGFKDKPVPVRTRPKVAAIWIHPHETATRDYFWGGWLSIVVEQDQWVLTKPGLTPKAPATIEISPTQGPSRSIQAIKKTNGKEAARDKHSRLEKSDRPGSR